VVKVKVKVNFTLEQATKAQRGSRWGWVVKATARPLYLWERRGTYCIGDWVGARADLDRFGKPHPHRDSIPGPSNP